MAHEISFTTCYIFSSAQRVLQRATQASGLTLSQFTQGFTDHKWRDWHANVVARRRKHRLARGNVFCLSFLKCLWQQWAMITFGPPVALDFIYVSVKSLSYFRFLWKYFPSFILSLFTFSLDVYTSSLFHPFRYVTNRIKFYYENKISRKHFIISTYARSRFENALKWHSRAGLCGKKGKLSVWENWHFLWSSMCYLTERDLSLPARVSNTKLHSSENRLTFNKFKASQNLIQNSFKHRYTLWQKFLLTIYLYR